MRGVTQTDISVILPALNEGPNLAVLIGRIRKVVSAITSNYEIVVADGGSRDNTREVATGEGARVFIQRGEGYGAALAEGLAAARGTYVITMDADLSHDPVFIAHMWRNREQAEVIIASRYVQGGVADMSAMRRVLSGILNFVFARLFALPLKDVSSGYRMYRREVLKNLVLHSRDYDVLEEILVKICRSGGRALEVPFHYKPRLSGKSHAKLFKFGISYMRTLVTMRLSRNR